jgi:hypothetical protein
MSEKNLKLWTCYPKKKIENFQEMSEDEEESNPHSYDEASESYSTENFTESNKLWSCYTSKEIEGFKSMSDNDSETASEDNKLNIEETVEKFKISIFGDGPNSDYYFYGSIAAIIFIIILGIRK